MNPLDRASITAMKVSIREDDFTYDPWGTSMAFYFALCDFMWEHDAWPPAVCQYRHGIGESDTDDPRYQEIAAIKPSTEACNYMSLLLNRYTSMLKRHGKDY